MSGFGRVDDPKSMNLSTFIQIIDPEFFSGLDEFKKQMSHTVYKAKTNKPISRKTIYIPGESFNEKKRSSEKWNFFKDVTKSSMKKLVQSLMKILIFI